MPVITSPNSPTAPSVPLDPGVDKVLNSLDQLGSKAGGDQLDLDFLKDLLESSDFLSLLKVHEKVTTPESSENEAVTNNAQDLHQEVCDQLQDLYTEEGQELLCLLLRPHFQALMMAHDSIALKEFQPDLPEVPHEVDEDEDSAIKLIKMVKGPNEPLGATIHLNEETGIVKISRVMRGGAADRCGMIHEGDEVQEVNGISVSGMDADHVVKLLSNAVGPIALKLVPAETDSDEDSETKMRVRAQFSYNPANDPMIPCKEAGLAFSKGDTLHVVSMSDANWWQAKRQDNLRTRAGLIPSRELQEKRFAALRAASSQNNNRDIKEIKNQRSWFSPKLNKKGKKHRRTSQTDEDTEEPLLTYEELTLSHPQDNVFRPIVLIGPPGVGRTVLKRRLMDNNPAHFKTPIPHTSRPMKTSEVNGEDYFFISKSEMEKDIENKKFIEHGEFKGHLYGTSIDQIKSVMSSGSVCFLCPQAQALRLLRSPEIRPYTILVKPPDFQKFRETRSAVDNTTDDITPSSLSDEEVHDLIAAADLMESQYAHFFDCVIINDNLQRTVNELGGIIHSVETEPQWIPLEWVR